MKVDASIIRKWHVEENGWRDIGYHFIILRDGTIQEGRPVDQVGAHCRGLNAHSIGICLVGGVDADNNAEFNFTPDQARELRSLIEKLQSQIEHHVAVSGHRDHDSGKACPCFDVKRWFSTGKWEA